MMKIFVVLFALILSFQYVSFADAPYKVDVEFNPQNRVPAVYVTHNTDDPLTHGVKEGSVSPRDTLVQRTDAGCRIAKGIEHRAHYILSKRALRPVHYANVEVPADLTRYSILDTERGDN